MDKERKVIDSIILAGMLFGMMLIGYAIGVTGRTEPPVEPLETKVDTLLIYDTMTVCEPVFVDRVRLDSILVPVTDSIMVHDTIYAYLQREQVVWRDSMAVVYASGIMPQVDSVRHFREYKVVTIESIVPVKVKSRWGLGVQAGVGASMDGLTPYVGVGLSYNILSW